MKASEVEKCASCGKHPLESGVGGGRAITFFRVTTERFALDPVAAQQTVGLTMQFGGALGLAEIMGGDPEVYKTSPDLRDVLLICDNCAATKPIFEILEGLS